MFRKNKQNKKTEQKNEVFEGIIGGLQEAIDFASGKPNKCTVYSSVKKIRKKQGLSQSKFAKEFGLNIETIKNWEQGKRMPTTIAKILLSVIDGYPDIVKKVVKAG